MGRKGREEVEEDLEDDVEDYEEAGSKKGNKRKASAFVDDAADEDDDEDDEEDDGPGGKKRGKKRRGAVSSFFDDIADVDDDEEEEEEDDDAEDLIDDHDVEILEPNQVHHANYRDISRQREEKTEEEIARALEERYKRIQEEGAYDTGSAALTSAGAVGQQAIQPTLNDPKLWLVHCRPGHEREVATQLLQKYYSMWRNKTPLLIKSAVALDHLKGYIYVEAEKEAHVRDAIKGLRTIFVSKGVKLVPLDQMVDAITVNRKAKASITRDQWVRIRNGVYKDDLAKVVEVDNASQKATIRLIPRVDLQAMAERAQDEEARKRNPFNRGPVRPPARPFNADEARQLGLLITRVPGLDGQAYLQLGSQRFINGYLERDVAFKSLNAIEGMPPLEELQRYNACGAAADELARGSSQGAAGDLSSLVAALPQGGAIPKTLFLKGDPVAIITGELKGIEATVDAVRDDGKVMVRPKVDGFNDVVDFDNDDLRKMFKVGDHVRVVTGPYANEIGIVLQVVPENDQCIIISDATRQELKTFGRDMTVTDVSNTGVDVLGEYQLHDLVQLDQNTAGVIINIRRESARVLTSASSPEQADLRVVKAADISRKLNNRKLLTSDAANNQVRCGDYVTFSMSANGRSQQKGGAVEYVWRGLLFLKSKEFLDTGGFTCVRANKSKVRGASQKGGMDLARQLANAPFSTPTSATPGSTPGGRGPLQFAPMSPSQYSQPANGNGNAMVGGGLRAGNQYKPPPPMSSSGGPGAFSGARMRAQTSSQLAGKTVRVVGGQYNGYRGRVKHETGTHAQLELDAISGRIVTVEKRYIQQDDGRNQAAGRSYPGPGRGAYDGGYSGSVGSQYGTRTPLHPSQTPLHPSMTPAHYSMTPSAPYTPAHAPTPSDDNLYMLGSHHEDRYHSARTPGMGGAYTPAYTPAAAATPSMYPDAHAAPTPAVDDAGMDDGPPLLADTPGLAPTPNIGAPAAAPTPYLPAPTPAITPGGDLAAPTPGMDLTAPTPGMHMDGMMGATPGLAPTPHTDHAYTPNIAATPTLPGATPGPEAMAAVEPRNYQMWEGLVVQIVTDGVEQANWPTAAVQGIAADGRLRVVLGSVPQGENKDFVEEPGAVEQLVHGQQLKLVRPQKKDRVRVLGAEQHAQMHVGHIAKVVGVDANDGDCILQREDASTSMCIVSQRLLGKLAMQVKG